MNLSRRLDTLQAMAQEQAEEPHRLYLIGLLAEHAEEEEMTMDFLKWVAGVLRASS